MPDAPTATAPTQAAVPAALPKPEPPKYTREFIPGDGFSLDAMLVKGYLEGTVKISKDMSVTFRTRSVEQDQHVEGIINVQNVVNSGKYQMNEMTITQIYFSLQALNGKPLPAIPSSFWEKDYKRELDLRRTWIRNLPTPLFDAIVPALTEFERRAKELISPESVQSF